MRLRPQESRTRKSRPPSPAFPYFQEILVPLVPHTAASVRIGFCQKESDYQSRNQALCSPLGRPGDRILGPHQISWVPSKVPYLRNLHLKAAGPIIQCAASPSPPSFSPATLLKSGLLSGFPRRPNNLPRRSPCIRCGLAASPRSDGHRSCSGMPSQIPQAWHRRRSSSGLARSSSRAGAWCMDPSRSPMHAFRHTTGTVLQS